MPWALISICAYPLCPITTHLQPAQRDKGSPLSRSATIKLPPSELYMRDGEGPGRRKDQSCVQNINTFQFSKQCLLFLRLQVPSRFIFKVVTKSFWLAVVMEKVRTYARLEVIMSVQCTHLNNIPVVRELLQRRGVEAERRERGGRKGVAGLLQRGQLVGRESRQGGKQEADVVHVLQSRFLAPNRPATKRRPTEHKQWTIIDSKSALIPKPCLSEYQTF